MTSPATKSSREHLPIEGHHASPQVGVASNPDPALDYVNEHTHAHTHHGGPALHEKEKLGMHDELVYTTGTTDKGRDLMDKPPQDYTNHKLNDTTVTGKSKSLDEESGNVGAIHDADGFDGPKPSRARQLLRKYRIVIHLAIWGVWTA